METASLIFKTTKTKNGETFYITVSLADECKNGHQDFHITADRYQAGKPKTDKYWLGGGACGDTVAAIWPEFAQFEALHGCDYLGRSYWSNGYFFLKNGFNRTSVNSETFPAEFCKNMRVPFEMWETLSKAESDMHFVLLLLDLDVLTLWKNQADTAIKTLEEWTGNKFVVNSTKDQFNMPDAAKLEAERVKLASGYYSDAAKAERLEQKKTAFVEGLRASAAKEIAKTERDLAVKIALFEAGGMRAYEGAIYYNHNNSICFNWRDYGSYQKNPITKDEAAEIMKHPVLAGLEYKMK